MSNTWQKIPEQEDVVFENRSQIVSASAGSGKTTVMIRKVTEHIKAKDCHVDELLILTYTTAAALEMKKKLVERLKKESLQDESLQDELELVQTADICTIDSFCQKLVKKYFYVLNIDPSFNILDAGDQIVLESKALDFALEKLKETSPQDYENLLANLSPARNDKNIKELVLQIHNYLISVYNQDEFWKKTFELYDSDKKIAEKYLKDYYIENLCQIKNELIGLQIQARDFGFDKYVVHINEVLSALDFLILAKSFSEMVENASQISFSILRSLKQDEIEFKAKIAFIKDKFKKLREELQSEYIDKEKINKSYKNCQSLILILNKLYKLFTKEYQQLKTKSNTYDFDDIERFACKLLENKQTVLEIKNSYKKIFVDEFQDANRLQEKIIFLLDNQNLFFVGDTKQSIYGFRQSEPDIFLEIEEKFGSLENASVKKLNCNFRTNKNILQFANHVFCQIMTKKSCGIDYKNTAQFQPMAKFDDLENETCVSLDVILEKDEPNEKLPLTQVYSVKQNAVETNKQSSFDYESAYICQKITELLGQNIFDKDAQKVRKINFNDIAILVNKRGAFLQTLLKHLKDTGIPYIVNVNDNLEECYDNQVLFNLLKLSQNFQDDYALYSVMSSYLFNFSDSELGEIKLENLQEKYFYNCVKNYASKQNKLADKIKYFLAILESFSFEVNYKGIYLALNKIIKDTYYLLKLKTEQDYAERKLNIQAFINSFANSKYNNNLEEYILYRDMAIRQEKVHVDKTFVKAVEITTMHSSKGLEYPVVILPFLSQDYLKSPFYSEININKHFGIGVKDFNSDERSVQNGIFYNACKLKNKTQEISEKIRLLYVAMTRAKNKLIMIGTAKKEYKQISDDNIFAQNNFLSLVLGTLPQEQLDTINNKQEYSCNLLDNPRINFNVVKIEDIQEELVEEKQIFPKQENLQDIINLAKFLQKSTKQTAHNIALKNSVSEFAFDENASHVFAPKTLNISEHMEYKASDMGTLYHKVLEICEFNQINSEEDLKVFAGCNFSDSELQMLNKIGLSNIYNSIEIIKKIISSSDIILKEQKFVMRVKHKEIVKDGEDCFVLVQGIVDLLAIQQNEIVLIDYKYTQKDDEQIKQTYQKQLQLYELALKKRFGNKKIRKIIINLAKNTCIYI